MSLESRQFLLVDYSVEKLRTMSLATLSSLRNLLAENLVERRPDDLDSHEKAVLACWRMLGEFEAMSTQKEGQMPEDTKTAPKPTAVDTKPTAVDTKPPAAPKAPKETAAPKLAFPADAKVTVNVDKNPKQAGKGPADRFDAMTAFVKKAGGTATYGDIIAKTSYTNADGKWDFDYGYIKVDGKVGDKVKPPKEPKPAKPAAAKPGAAAPAVTTPAAATPPKA